MFKSKDSGITPIIILLILLIISGTSILLIKNILLLKSKQISLPIFGTEQNTASETNISSSSASQPTATSDDNLEASPSSTPKQYKHISVIEYIKNRSLYSPLPQPSATSAPQTSSQPAQGTGVTPSPTASAQPVVSTSQALDATLSFSPSSGNVNKGCSLSLGINLDTANKYVDGVDILVDFDPQKIQFISLNSENKFNGRDISILGTSYNNNLGTFIFSALSMVGKPINGFGKIATVNLFIKPDAGGNAEVKFRQDPSLTTTSNVIEYGSVTNILKKIVNGNYTITSGSCSN